MESATLIPGKNSLPNRWAFKHGAYYYRVPQSQVSLWGRQWYRLGTTFDEAPQAFRAALASLSGKSFDLVRLAEKARNYIDNPLCISGPVIYFLLKEGEVVYVGKSLNVIKRLTSHQDKDFDAVATVPCDHADIDLLEIAYISALDPKLNVRIKESGTAGAYFV